MDVRLAHWASLLFLVTLTLSSSWASDRPIIGILSQELSHYLATIYNSSIYTSYIAASYVKYYESSGSRVAVIPVNGTLDYYRGMVSHLNGVVFPGGGLDIGTPTEYRSSGHLLLRALQEAAERGRPVPALGVCLGLELMVLHDYTNGNANPPPDPDPHSPLVPCNCHALSLPLNLTADASTSPLFSRARADDLKALQTRPITANEHRVCVTPSTLARSGLERAWRILSTSSTPDGEEFISAMESRHFPFYAVIFHPEKNSFEWKASKTYAHDTDAVAAMRIFGDSFVALCKENNNSFPPLEERKVLIYGHETRDSGAAGTAYEQIYLFRPNSLH